ncbi:MAG: lysozyme family protein/peptidoglycan hydrolase-like protein with peptidoglycan-binding domain [Myxococcota bacterium]|jgi:lysozyme family protein/peptidoglycan hydrolase-like protein with peptidoglycan-binding domain
MSGKKRRPGGRQQRRQNIFKRVQRWRDRQEGSEVSSPSPDLDDGGPELDTPLLDQVQEFGQDNQPPAPGVDGPAAEPARVEGPLTFTREVYQKHQGQTGEMEMDTAGMEGEIEPFQEHWAANQGRYEGVAAQTGIPAELVAAIHWREGSGNFGTYLHQGDPLGVAAVNWPTDIPVFHNWEKAAVHALQMKDSIRRDLGLNENSTDVAAMATFAEYYNGLGYHNRGADSAYAYSGTDQYESGKYVADGVYDPNTVDRQVGVRALMDAIDADFEQTAAVGDMAGSGFGKQLLRQGASGEDVLQMQQLLNEQGADLEADGVYGPLTAGAVRDFQRANGLEVDGICGPVTASVLLGNGIPTHDNPAPQEGGGGVTSGGGAVPTSEGLAGERGALAAKSARMELVEGQGEYGSGTWETGGANQGAMVNESRRPTGRRPAPTTPGAACSSATTSPKPAFAERSCATSCSGRATACTSSSRTARMSAHPNPRPAIESRATRACTWLPTVPPARPSSTGSGPNPATSCCSAPTTATWPW